MLARQGRDSITGDMQHAERFVGACRYPPAGYRSIGPIRASLYAGADHVAKAAERVVTPVMIETKEAMDDLDESMSAAGLDGVYVGPNDLSIGRGRPASLDSRDAVAMEAIGRIEERFHLVTAGSDARFIIAGAGAAVSAMRKTPRLAH